MTVVPVEAEPEPPEPPPPKLERQKQTHTRAYSRGEALTEPAGDNYEPDEYDKGVNEPVAPAVMKQLTRVDKLRTLARNGLP